MSFYPTASIADFCSSEIFTFVTHQYYPRRIPPRKWPDKKLIGKAMARGWAVPCRYYPRPWRRGGICRSFVYPGISDEELKTIHALMNRRNHA